MKEIAFRLLMCLCGCVFLGGVFVWQGTASIPLDTTQPPFSPSPTFATTISPTLYLPIISRPEILKPSSEALLEITPFGQLNASTFNTGAFVLTNLPTDQQAITEVTIDLRTAVFPDMVFDPAGVAGDVVAKDLTIEWGLYRTGFLGHTFSSPHDGGYDVLTLFFNSFDPDDHLEFSIDVDPTSIKGADVPGPNESGSVSGLELAGATVIVTFANGAVHTGAIYRQSNSLGGGSALVRDHLPPAPTISILGITTPPVVVTQANQVVQINGLPNTNYKILQIEGGLFTAGVPGNGFDLDPFEANSALSMIEHSVRTDSSGQVDVSITLIGSQPEGGINMILAVTENIFGHKSITATPIILQLQN